MYLFFQVAKDKNKSWTVSEIPENVNSIYYLYTMHKKQNLSILVNGLITKKVKKSCEKS